MPLELYHHHPYPRDSSCSSRRDLSVFPPRTSCRCSPSLNCQLRPMRLDFPFDVQLFFACRRSRSSRRRRFRVCRLVSTPIRCGYSRSFRDFVGGLFKNLLTIRRYKSFPYHERTAAHENIIFPKFPCPDRESVATSHFVRFDELSRNKVHANNQPSATLPCSS